MDAITEVALDSIYNHAYAVLHGDVEDPDYESVKARLEICANAQDARCATLLGYHLIKGFKLKRDVQSGVRYLNEAARLNNVEAMLYLSDYYYESGRVDSSLVLLEKAHENESSEATYVLSEIYLKGINVRLGRPELKYSGVVSAEKGIMYLQSAAEKSLEAKFSLANYYLKGIDDQLVRDTANAAELLKEVLADEALDSIPGFRDRVEMQLEEISKF